MPNPSPNSRPIFIAEIEQFGGAERSLLALSAWLYRHGLANYLVTYADHCGLAQYADHPVEVVALNPAAGVRHKMAALRQHFDRRQDSAFRPLLSGYQPALHATLAGLRGFHDLMHDTPSLFGDQDRRTFRHKLRIAVSNRIAGHGLRSGGRTIVTSEYLRSECARDFGVDAAIVRMGGMRRTDGARPAFAAGTLRMLSVCRIEANKRIDWILRALAALEKSATPLSSQVDWRLDLAGKGSQIPFLKEMATTYGIASRVHFHGFVADHDLEDMYDRAQLFLMPAVQGYGIPAIEAIQRGIPVLLHRESGVSDILTDTAWATVLHGDEPKMLPTLRRAIDKAISATHVGIAPPHLPTEEEWAEQVARLCNWIP